MNRNAKGAIAVGAATLLLLGGGGTFALWNDTSTVNAGTVSSGHLEAGAFTGSWKDQNGDAFAPGTDIAVPGDVLTYTATSDISANGTNLLFTAFIDPDTVDDALAQGWTLNAQSVSVAGTDFSTTLAADGSLYNPTSLPASIDVIALDAPSAATGTLTYSFTIAFGDNAGAGVDNPTHDNTTVLNGLTLTVQQVFLK